MTPDRDAERAWEKFNGPYRGAIPGETGVQTADREAKAFRAHEAAKAIFLAGRASVLDDHPAVLRAAVAVIDRKAPNLMDASHEMRQLADRLAVRGQ